MLTFVHIGNAIAAYERLIMPSSSRFDQYVQAVLQNDYKSIQMALTPDEVAGLACVYLLGHEAPLSTLEEYKQVKVQYESAITTFKQILYRLLKAKA